jgi:hypothetical protein
MSQKLVFSKFKEKKKVLGDWRIEKVSLKKMELEKKLVKKEIYNTKLDLM